MNGQRDVRIAPSCVPTENYDGDALPGKEKK
jgi:hypothetical protein